MASRGLLWIAFAIVHLVVAWLGFVLPNQPMGDLTNVYDPWSAEVLAGGPIAGIGFDWVYPQLAMVPLVIVQIFAPLLGYPVAWAVFVTAVDALAFALLVGRGRSRGRMTAAWFWVAFTGLLGPIALYRLDAVTVPLALAGCLWLASRPWLGSALLAAAMWIKVWPAALLAAAVMAVTRRSVVLGGAIAVSIAVIAVSLALGGAAHLFGFVLDQTGRGLQIEAPVSAWWVWQAMLGVPGVRIAFDHDIITYQVEGAGVDAVAAVMTPVLACVMIAVVGLGALKAARGVRFSSLFPPLSLALVLGFIVFNKVGSPQYLTWIVAPIVLALVLDRRRWAKPAVLALFAAVLTQVIYPVGYDQLLDATPLLVGILTARNLLLIALFAWTVTRLARVGARHPSLVRS